MVLEFRYKNLGIRLMAQSRFAAIMAKRSIRRVISAHYEGNGMYYALSDVQYQFGLSDFGVLPL